MFAIVTIGGFQERATPGAILRVPKIEGEVGSTVQFTDVLLMSKGDGDLAIGTPLVKGASVTAKIVKHDRDDKLRVVKFRRRKRYHRVKGHRQDKTEIEVIEVNG